MGVRALVDTKAVNGRSEGSVSEREREREREGGRNRVSGRERERGRRDS